MSTSGSIIGTRSAAIIDGNVELLAHDSFDTGRVSLFDDRAHFGSENVVFFGFAKQRPARASASSIGLHRAQQQGLGRL